MDSDTLVAYNSEAVKFAKDWLDQPAPEDMYALLVRYFKPGLTADIGCGSGRDVAWLNGNGYEAIGYDASDGLLGQARTLHPNFRFEKAALPELDGLQQDTFENVLCETVIMHLATELIGSATRRLLGILRPEGTLYLSWRVTDGISQRDKHRRLYAVFNKTVVLDECVGHVVLLDQEEVSSSSGKTVHRVIVRKSA